ncbi:Cof-type HAD-IIB family hydrolase [Paenibacillus filicis]|uniref:Cof-type HAD-IIB family hydrolase n=1 Tax=Paenibacillus gyeongsangnamensis TaxID=3388067 RepID=A0ABT4Q3F3_9BACL|nr:Cof-type HAD-IIB family hydrolase [Paenibacillus filicis]MCZ8511341.1 Cof-type HAD-IIB family hydrolase [Paenibacillus filicis]
MESQLFSGYLLVTDMDGTLLGADKSISPDNLAAIERFTAQGGRFTLATGRIASSVRRYAEQLPLGAPAILCNGAMIYDFASGETVWERMLPVSDAEGIIQRMLSLYPQIGVEIYPKGWDVPFFRNENEVTQRHERMEKFRRRADSAPAEPWIKVLFAWEPARLDAITPHLQELTGSAEVEWIRSDDKYLELLAKDSTKGHALEALTRRLGMDPAKSIAMGDHLNDLEMIRRAGVGVAVANAHPELRAAAGHHAKHHEEHAVADVIEWLEQRIRSGM